MGRGAAGDFDGDGMKKRRGADGWTVGRKHSAGGRGRDGATDEGNGARIHPARAAMGGRLDGAKVFSMLWADSSGAGVGAAMFPPRCCF